MAGQVQLTASAAGKCKPGAIELMANEMPERVCESVRGGRWEVGGQPLHKGTGRSHSGARRFWLESKMAEGGKSEASNQRRKVCTEKTLLQCKRR